MVVLFKGLAAFVVVVKRLDRLIIASSVRTVTVAIQFLTLTIVEDIHILTVEGVSTPKLPSSRAKGSKAVACQDLRTRPRADRSAVI